MPEIYCPAKDCLYNNKKGYCQTNIVDMRLTKDGNVICFDYLVLTDEEYEIMTGETKE